MCSRVTHSKKQTTILPSSPHRPFPLLPVASSSPPPHLLSFPSPLTGPLPPHPVAGFPLSSSLQVHHPNLATSTTADLSYPCDPEHAGPTTSPLLDLSRRPHLPDPCSPTPRSLSLPPFSRATICAPLLLQRPTAQPSPATDLKYLRTLDVAASRSPTTRSPPPMATIEDGTDSEFEEECLVGYSNVNKNISGFQISHVSSVVNASQSFRYNGFAVKMLKSVQVVIFKAKINVLLPFGPLAIILHYLTGKQGLVFFFSLVGIIPLAERLGYATEQLAFYTGSTVGGLLNATFGNATELIISIYALKNGMIRVVQQSLLGSILSNMLLVLGCAFFTGGLVHYKKKDQVFNKAAAMVNSGLLLMAVMGTMFPAVLHFTRSEVQFGKSELSLSRFSSCIMLVAYGSYLFYQLNSHHSPYHPIDEEETHQEEVPEEMEAPDITFWEAIIWLGALTVWISILSGFLVDAIQGASDSMNLPVAFISVVLLPIVGNAAEHASAIMFAMKDKLDITIGVAIGSSTQISMFVIPFCVVLGWMMGKQMDLNFQLFETATLFITVLVVAFMLQEGTANYFKGLMLILCYLIVAASFFVHMDPQDIDS